VGTLPQETREKTFTPKIKTFDSLTVPGYRVYYGSMAANWFAMNMLMVVRVLLIYRLSGSAAAAGGLALANAVPTLLVSIIGGAVGDRMEKRRLMMLCRAGLVVLALAISILLGAGYLSPKYPASWWFLIASAVFEGAIMGLMWPVNTSIIPELVGMDRVMNAIFLSTTVMNIFRLVGPAVAGYCVDAYGFAAVYYLITAVYGISLLFTFFLPRTGVASTGGGTALSDTVKGFSYLGREHVMLLIVVFAVCHIVSGQPFQQLFPVYTESVLRISASKMGLLTGLSGLGAMVGSLALASFTFRKRGAMLLFSGVILGIPALAFTCLHQWWIALVVMPLVGLGMAMHAGLTSTLIQTYAEPDYRSRMQGFFATAGGLAGFGTFTTGILAEVIGVQTAIGISAFILSLASILFLIFAKDLRRME
jgi:MFS family permease